MLSVARTNKHGVGVARTVLLFAGKVAEIGNGIGPSKPQHESDVNLGGRLIMSNSLTHGCMSAFCVAPMVRQEKHVNESHIPKRATPNKHVPIKAFVVQLVGTLH